MVTIKTRAASSATGISYCKKAGKGRTPVFTGTQPFFKTVIKQLVEKPAENAVSGLLLIRALLANPGSFTTQFTQVVKT